MRTTRTQDRRTSRQIVISFCLYLFTQHFLTEKVGTIFALSGEKFFSLTRDSPGPYLFLDHRLQFLKNVEFINFRCKFFNHFLWQRMNHTQFQNRGLRTYFFYILIWNTTGNKSNLGIIHLNPVNGKITTVLFQFFHALFYPEVAFFRHTRHHNILRRISLIRNIILFHTLSQCNRSLGMSQSGSSTEDNRCIISLTDTVSLFYKVFGFLTVRRLQHRYDGCSCYRSGILLILGTVKSRIICYHDHQTSGSSYVRSCIQWIAGHIQSYMFHGRHRPYTTDGRSDGHFGCYFFIR